MKTVGKFGLTIIVVCASGCDLVGLGGYALPVQAGIYDDGHYILDSYYDGFGGVSSYFYDAPSDSFGWSRDYFGPDHHLLSSYLDEFGCVGYYFYDVPSDSVGWNRQCP